MTSSSASMPRSCLPCLARTSSLLSASRRVPDCSRRLRFPETCRDIRRAKALSSERFWSATDRRLKRIGAAERRKTATMRRTGNSLARAKLKMITVVLVMEQLGRDNREQKYWHIRRISSSFGRFSAVANSVPHLLKCSVDLALKILSLVGNM